jgi:erythromycin esterase
MPRTSIFRALAVLAALALAGCRDTTASDNGGWSAILDDLELITPADPNAPEENEEWVRWIRRSHQPIRSLTSTDFEDLQFLEGVLAGKRVVQLGESSHGIKEFNQAKVRLIRYLHEEQGFDVIAFESGLFECWRANESVGNVDPLTTMRSCIFGVWHTEEVLELFEYIKQTRGTSRPLVLAGMDMQVSSGIGTQGAPTFVQQVLNEVDFEYGRRVSRLERDYRAEYLALRDAGARPGPDFAPLRRFQPGYDSLVAYVDANLAALTAAHGGKPERALVLRQLAYSRRQEIEQGSNPDPIQRALVREVGMADNLDALLDRIYPGKKVMVWAHNAHIQHDRASLIPDGPPQEIGAFNSMGHFVDARRGDELYTVGLFMYRGRGAHNDRTIYDVAPALSGSVESLGYRVRKKHFFLDLAGAGGPGSDWARSTVVLKDWGIWDMRQVPAEQYDGILFVDTVNPPDYLLTGA